MRKTESVPSSYFENKYQHDIDPWQFKTSNYEKDKYAATIKALSRPHYDAALEVGCSIGVFTRLLAPFCGKLVAIDASATALVAAREVNDPSVVFELATLPQQFPPGKFNLIVLSEVLYYFSQADLELVTKQCLRALAPRGEIAVCHWLGETDYPLTGARASELFSLGVASQSPLRTILHNETYRLERYLFA